MAKDVEIDYKGPSEEERARIRKAMKLAAEGVGRGNPESLIEAFETDSVEAAHYVLAALKGYTMTKKQLAEARQMASIDGRTGLFRAERYATDVINMLADMERDKKSGDPRDWSSLLILDIDHFKMFNEEGGYNAGNRALAAVAHEIKAEAGSSGDAYRYGGEEFAILLPRTNPNDAKELGENIRKRVEARGMPFPKDSHRQLTISGGVGYIGGENYPRENNRIYTSKRLVGEFFGDMEEADPEGRDRIWKMDDFKDTMGYFHAEWDQKATEAERLAVIRKYTRKLKSMKGIRDFHLNLLGKTVFYRADRALKKSKNGGRNKISVYRRRVSYI